MGLWARYLQSGGTSELDCIMSRFTECFFYCIVLMIQFEVDEGGGRAYKCLFSYCFGIYGWAYFG